MSQLLRELEDEDTERAVKQSHSAKPTEVKHTRLREQKGNKRKHGGRSGSWSSEADSKGPDQLWVDKYAPNGLQPLCLLSFLSFLTLTLYPSLINLN